MINLADRCAARWAVGLVASALAATPASAERLRSWWQLEPTTPLGTRSVEFDKVFLEQRLIPVATVQLAAELRYAKDKTLAADTILFAVSNDRGDVAYCTSKNRDAGHAAKSLFIPMLDKRPCFVDADKDGRFEASFSVFDKYGSALTPSGSIGSASPIAVPTAYRPVDPKLYPIRARLAFKLSGSRNVAKARVDVDFDNGAGYRPGFAPNRRDGNRVDVVNLNVTIAAIVDKTATIDVGVEPRVCLMGDSDGNFIGAEVPATLRSRIAS